MNRYVGNLAPMPGVFPDYPAPVIRNVGDAEQMVLMRWGTPPPPKTGGPPVTNIRNTSSPHWRGWLKPESRCLVPANSFAEYAPEPNPETKKKDIVWFAMTVIAHWSIHSEGRYFQLVSDEAWLERRRNNPLLLGSTNRRRRCTDAMTNLCLRHSGSPRISPRTYDSTPPLRRARRPSSEAYPGLRLMDLRQPFGCALIKPGRQAPSFNLINDGKRRSPPDHVTLKRSADRAPAVTQMFVKRRANSLQKDRLKNRFSSAFSNGEHR
jgi:hypothetical protein